MVLLPRKWRLHLSCCSGTSLSLTVPAPLSRKSLRRADTTFFVPFTGGSPCHSAGKFLSTEAIFNLRLKVLRATALEGTPEPQAEWPFHTVNSAKAQEVRNAGFAWLVDGWFFLRTVLPPNNSLFPLPPLGSCPPSGHLTDAWSL